MASFLLAVSLVVCGQTDKAATKESKLVEIPDPRYTPKRGDHAIACNYHEAEDRLYRASAATYEFAYEERWKALDIKDYEGIRELEKRGVLIDLAVGTELLVIEIEVFDVKDPRADCATARVMSGPHEGKKVWLATHSVNRMIPNPSYRAKLAPTRKDNKSTSSDPNRLTSDAKPTLKVGAGLEQEGRLSDAIAAYNAIILADPGTSDAKTAAKRIKAIEARGKKEASDKKAAKAFAIAQKLEKANLPDAALRSYRGVVKEFPDSPSAEEAAERIKALEKP